MAVIWGRMERGRVSSGLLASGRAPGAGCARSRASRRDPSVSFAGRRGEQGRHESEVLASQSDARAVPGAATRSIPGPAGPYEDVCDPTHPSSTRSSRQRGASRLLDTRATSMMPGVDADLEDLSVLRGFSFVSVAVLISARWPPNPPPSPNVRRYWTLWPRAWSWAMARWGRCSTTAASSSIGVSMS